MKNPLVLLYLLLLLSVITPELVSAIVGGTDTSTYLPELVVVNNTFQGGDEQICGGILFSSDGSRETDLVVLNANCLFSFPNFLSAEVSVGVFNLTSSGIHATITASVFAIHPCYAADQDPDTVTSFYDLAVLKLDNPVDGVVAYANNNVNKNNDFPSLNGQDMITYGGGITDESDPTIPTYIQELKIQYLRTCFGALQAQYVSDTHICSVYPPNSGPCEVGAPLYRNGIVVGLSVRPTRFDGSFRCTGNEPFLYTRLSTSFAWLQEQECRLSSSPPANCATLSFEPFDCFPGDMDTEECGCCCRAYRSVRAWASRVGSRMASLLWSS